MVSLGFAEIQLDIDADAPEITDFSVPDWGMPEDPSLEQLDDEDAQDAPNEDMQDEE